MLTCTKFPLLNTIPVSLITSAQRVKQERKIKGDSFKYDAEWQGLRKEEENANHEKQVSGSKTSISETRWGFFPVNKRPGECVPV